MDHCIRSLCVDQKYCSPCVITYPDHVCTCAHPCAAHPHPTYGRCWQTNSTPHYTHVTCTNLRGASHIPCLPIITRFQTVLARREPDGFYYLGVVRHREESGVFLIEFIKPAEQSGQSLTTLQKTNARDIIQYEEAQRHCIVPGDHVLAPWEPEQTRYGPGVVILGMETRDPLCDIEDEELTVSFWNGKRASVPLATAVWISPTVHYRIVDLLHHPISSWKPREDNRKRPTTYVFTDHCTTMPTPLCTAEHHHLHHCYLPTYPTCCPDSHCQDCWATTIHCLRNKKTEDMEAESGNTRRCKDHYFPSSSGSDSEQFLEDEDMDSDTEISMVDSAVNTDSSLWEKARPDISNRPEWKYWKRGQPEPFHRKPGIIKQKSAKATKEPRAAVPDVIKSTNQSALFETIPDSPARCLTMKDVLVHTEFAASQPRPAPPAIERLGLSEVEKLRREREVAEKQLQHKLKHREWEQKREEESLRKYSERREVHRNKTLQRLQNEELTLHERERQNMANMEAKMAASEERKERHVTIAAEDKKREQRRIAHLREVREKIDQREFQKCAANEQREIGRMAAQRQKMDNHYRQVAEKVFQAEQL